MHLRFRCLGAHNFVGNYHDKSDVNNNYFKEIFSMSNLEFCVQTSLVYFSCFDNYSSYLFIVLRPNWYLEVFHCRALEKWKSAWIELHVNKRKVNMAKERKTKKERLNRSMPK